MTIDLLTGEHICAELQIGSGCDNCKKQYPHLVATSLEQIEAGYRNLLHTQVSSSVTKKERLRHGDMTVIIFYDADETISDREPAPIDYQRHKLPSGSFTLLLSTRLGTIEFDPRPR